MLKKRLKNYYRKKELMRARIKGPGNQEEKYDYLAVIDFEATCQENNTMDYKHEIIEFPIVLVDTAQRKIVSTFSVHFFISMPVKAVAEKSWIRQCKVLRFILLST